MGIVFENTSGELIAFALIFFALGYYYVNWKFNYWQRRGVQFLKPSFPFGNFQVAFLQRRSIGDHIRDMYNASTDPFNGTYNALMPSLFIRDPELIRSVLIKDFTSFQDRGFHCEPTYDPLSGHLFALSGEQWKTLRGKLTPSFTSGKLKAMFSTIVDCGGPLTEYIEKRAVKGDPVEFREILAQYMTNIIASVAFGIDIDCIKDPDTPFRKYGRKFLELSIKNGVRGAAGFLFPSLMSLFKMKSVDQDVEDFVVSVVRQNMEHREKNNISRKDFFQLLVQLRNTGDIQVDGLWETKITNDDRKKKLSINECAAQAFIFYVAGFETSSTTLSFALYELSKNVECQRKVQKEIDDVLKKHDGKVTYESVSEMKYLECCIDETLRKYPPVPMLNRKCNTPWTIPNTNIVIQSDTPILIPVYGIQHDPKYYPEPEKFIPERFSSEINKSFVEMPYLPFGEGPRNCIGMRLGKLQTKVGLILCLQKYSYELAGSSKKPIEMSVSSIVLTPIGGINLKIAKRNYAEV